MVENLSRAQHHGHVENHTAWADDAAGETSKRQRRIVRHRQERDEAACRLCGQNYGEFNTCACTWGTSMTSQRDVVENEDANALRIVSHLRLSIEPMLSNESFSGSVRTIYASSELLPP